MFMLTNQQPALYAALNPQSEQRLCCRLKEEVVQILGTWAVQERYGLHRGFIHT